jgi:hypothetical protein
LTSFKKRRAATIIRKATGYQRFTIAAGGKMLCLVRPKACPRCGGDLSLEFDVYGVYATCIQCGATCSKKDMITSTRDAKRTKALAERPPEVSGRPPASA